MKKKISAEKIVTAGVMAMIGIMAAVVFVLWAKSTGNHDYMSPSFWAAVDSLILFTIAFCYCVANFFRDITDPFNVAATEKEREIQEEKQDEKTDEKLNGKHRTLCDFGLIFVLFILWGVLIFLLCGVLKKQSSDAPFFEGLCGLMRSLDSNQYLFIAENWYTFGENLATDVSLVFLPGYPVLVKLIGKVIGDYYVAGEILSITCFGLTGGFMYLVAALDGGRKAGFKAVAYLAIIPGVFFFITPMSESLFLFLTLATVYFVRKKKWLPAALFGCYASFTRSAGVFVAIIFVYELALDFWQGEHSGKRLKKAILNFLYVFIIPVGLGAYLLINKLLTGNAFQFLIYQKQNWSQSLGYFFNTANYMVKYLISYVGSGNLSSALGIWVMGLFAIFGLLILFIVRGKKLRTSYFLYSLVYFAFSMGATWLLSAPRYAIGLFTLPIMLSTLTEKKWSTALSLLRFAALGGVYIMMFVLRWQVW